MAIILPPNSTGTTVDTNTVGGKDREVVNIGDPTAAATAAVKATTPLSGDIGLVVRNTPRKEGQTLSTTALGISGVFTQTFQDSTADGALFVEAAVRADVASATNGFIIQESDDNADANFTRTVAAASVSANTLTIISAIIRGRFWRVQYTNGGTAQLSFRLTSSASAHPEDGIALPNYDTTAGNIQGVPAMGIALPAAGGAVAGGTATNPLQVSVANTGANATSIKVDGSAVTQPVSIAAAVDVSDRAARLVGQIEGRAASGTAKAGNPVQNGYVFNTTQPTVTTGQAVEAQGTARGAAIVSTGVDVFNVTVNAALPTGANVIGALSANQSVNVAQINAVTPLMGNGVTGTGSPRVTIASDNTAFSVNAIQSTAAAASGAWPVKPTDGTNVVTVKAASIAALASDTALVVTTNGSTTSSTPAQTAQGTTSALILAANTARRQVIIQNTGTTVIKLNLGGTAVTATAYHVALKAATAADDGSGGVFISDIWKGAIQAISSAVGGTLVITELT